MIWTRDFMPRALFRKSQGLPRTCAGPWPCLGGRALMDRLPLCSDGLSSPRALQRRSSQGSVGLGRPYVAPDVRKGFVRLVGLFHRFP